MITCKKCGEQRDDSEFPVYKVIGDREYRRKTCNLCYYSDMRKWNEKNPDAKQRAYVARVWGLTLEEYRELLTGGCEVCGTLEQLTIDHDHECCPGKETCGECIRGVLCNRHNLAEGNLRGDPEEAYALAEYMKKHWKGELL